MPDDRPPDPPLDLEPDAPPPPRAERADRRDDRDDDRYEDHRDRDYHPRGRHVKLDEDGHEITQEHIMWAVFAHIGVFVVGFFAPLIILLAMGGKSPFIRRHARESLNHIITLIFIELLIVLVGAAIGWGVYLATQDWLVGLIVFEVVVLLPALALSIANIVFLVLATVAASKGNEYRYPYTLRLIG